MFYKIAILAATVAASPSARAGKAKGKGMNPFGEDVPYFHGFCGFKNAEDKKFGWLQFVQESTDDAED